MQGQPGDKGSSSALPIPKQARNIVDVRTERDLVVEAIAWRVDPTGTGALESQPSSADTQQGSSSVVSSVSLNSSNMPPGFISLAANRANAADLIRGRGALRTLPASAQTAGTAVSLLPPQNAAASNLSLSLQALFDHAQTTATSISAIDESQQRIFTSLSALDESQQRILRNIRGPATVERSARADQEPFVSSVSNENIGGTVAPSHRLTRER